MQVAMTAHVGRGAEHLGSRRGTTLCIDRDSRVEADRLYGALPEGGSEVSPMPDMPWGAYWGGVLDRYGIRWMVNHTLNSLRTPSNEPSHLATDEAVAPVLGAASQPPSCSRRAAALAHLSINVDRAASRTFD